MARSLENGDELADMVQSRPQIRALFCGHVHHEFAGRMGDVAVHATPSTSTQFVPRGIEPEYDNLPPGYRVIELDAGYVRTHVVRLPECRFPPLPGS